MQNFVYKSLKNEERQFTLILSWTITSFFAVACENNKSIKRCKFSHTLQASWLGIASVSTSTFSSLSVSPPLSSLALRWLSKKLVCRPLTDWTRTTDTFLGVMWCKRDTTSAWQPLPTKHSTSARSAKTRFTDVDTCHTKKAFGVLKARPAAVNRMLIVLFMGWRTTSDKESFNCRGCSDFPHPSKRCDVLPFTLPRRRSSRSLISYADGSQFSRAASYFSCNGDPYMKEIPQSMWRVMWLLIVRSG